MEKNDLGVYSYNNVTAKPNDDGAFTINFGGDPKQQNYMPITKGWYCLIRMYQPRKELLDGSWKFPRPQEVKQGTDFEKQVQEYIKKFPYQDTYNYAVKYTGSDAVKFNTWVLGVDPVLVKAGQDKVVRMNNDTYYKMAFMLLDEGPVVLESAKPSSERFYSFQRMDDHNVNFRNVIHLEN